MRLLFIRHGDPDYERDGLTPAGEVEARLLVPRMQRENITEFFVSPLGRAQATARPTLEALGRTAEEYGWLRDSPSPFSARTKTAPAPSSPGTGCPPTG